MAHRHPYDPYRPMYNDPYRPRMSYLSGYGRGFAPLSPYKNRMPHPIQYHNPYHVSDDGNYSNYAPNSAESWAASVRKEAPVHKQTLPNNVLESYIEELQSVWQDPRLVDSQIKGEALLAKLSTILKVSPNPWETALYLITNASDYSQAKTVSLSFAILTQFQNWVLSSSNHCRGREEEFLNEDLRVRIFYATTGKQMPFFNTAVKAFHLDHIGNEYFVPITKSLLERNKLTEVTYLI